VAAGEEEERLKLGAVAEVVARLRSGAAEEEQADPRLLVAVEELELPVRGEAEEAPVVQPAEVLAASSGVAMEEHLLMAPWEVGEGARRLADQPLVAEVEEEQSHD
jgi:hypothetical protein